MECRLECLCVAHSAIFEYQVKRNLIIDQNNSKLPKINQPSPAGAYVAWNIV